MARVQVSDEVWSVYRASLGGTPVSVALGELVRREVGRAARRSANDADGARLALEDARALLDELAALIARLEKAADSAAEASGDLESASHVERPHWADDLLWRSPADR
jgi:hypothetical protein